MSKSSCVIARSLPAGRQAFWRRSNLFRTKKIASPKQQARNDTSAQTLLEYLILIGIITVVLFAMYHGVKRGVQSVIKITADQIGNQQKADQIAPGLSNEAIIPGPIDHQPVATSGYLAEAYTATRASNQKEVTELEGDIGYSYEERVSINSNSLTNLGFNPRGGGN